MCEHTLESSPTVSDECSGPSNQRSVRALVLDLVNGIGIRDSLVFRASIPVCTAPAESDLHRSVPAANRALGESRRVLAFSAAFFSSLTFCSKRFNSPTRCFSLLFSSECCSFSCQHPIALIHHLCNELSIVILVERHLINLLLHPLNRSQRRQQVLAGLHLWVTSKTRANDSTEPHACLMPATKRKLCSSVTGTFPLPHNKKYDECGYTSQYARYELQCPVCF